MLRHLVANVKLVVVTLVLCCVVYPGLLLVIGQVLFPYQAEGSLLTAKDAQGKEVVIGSRLIAQPFAGDEYFQPRPSAAAYNGAASGASNWSANNPLLRDRVARQVGSLVKYRVAPPSGNTVQQDVQKWFEGKPSIVADWADQHPSAAQAWVNADDKHKRAVTTWAESHPDAVAEWKKANPDAGEPRPADLAVPFFKGNAGAFHRAWPKLIDDATWTVPAVFFDLWLQEHPTADLEKVPADMVMASGSGLDPHLTLKSALYQLDRVAGKWAETTKQDKEKVRAEIEQMLRDRAGAPLGGLAGVPMVNVLEMNLALKEHFAGPGQQAAR